MGTYQQMDLQYLHGSEPTSDRDSAKINYTYGALIWEITWVMCFKYFPSFHFTIHLVPFHQVFFIKGQPYDFLSFEIWEHFTFLKSPINIFSWSAIQTGVLPLATLNVLTLKSTHLISLIILRFLKLFFTIESYVLQIERFIVWPLKANNTWYIMFSWP